MSSLQKKGFILIILFQVLVLSYMIVNRIILLEKGRVVTLKCMPIDPRSLFSGDYVILSYKISSFRSKKFKELNPRQEIFKEHETIYVALSRNENDIFWDASEVSHDLEHLKNRYDVVLRGEYVSKYSNRIKFGVESYFVPQYEGRKIEKKLRDAYVDIAVSESGESGIKRLYIEGEEVKFR